MHTYRQAQTHAHAHAHARTHTRTHAHARTRTRRARAQVRPSDMHTCIMYACVPAHRCVHLTGPECLYPVPCTHRCVHLTGPECMLAAKLHVAIRNLLILPGVLRLLVHEHPPRARMLVTVLGSVYLHRIHAALSTEATSSTERQLWVRG